MSEGRTEVGGDGHEHKTRSGLSSWLRTWALRVTILLGVAGVFGFMVAALGVIPIKASSGHWAITEWFLNFSMERSVKFHSMGTKPPPLDDPRLVMMGAGHYETGCGPCHGTPEIPGLALPQFMTPRPPGLPQAIPNWDAAELFHIVKHGVKFTGMPAWPARHRDDEVWAMVAFLVRLPEMSPEEYKFLAHGGDASADAPRLATGSLFGGAPVQAARSCARCHGADGLGRGAYPRLAGQRVEYLSNALEAYRLGARHSGMMEHVATGLTPEMIQELAEHYAGLPPGEPAMTTATDGDLAAGEIIALQGLPHSKVPSCADCHGPTSSPRNAAYPDLAGQDRAYLVRQLLLFKEGHRGGSRYAHLMLKVAPHLTNEQITNVATYYSSLPAGEAAAAPGR